MFRWVAVGALLLAIGGCTGSPPSYHGPTYTCCLAADIDRVYHPGDTLSIHWIAQGSPAPSGAEPHFELNAHLDGPFGTVTELKGGAAPPHTLAAAPLRPTGVAGEQPVSTIPIPLTAEPGSYDLVTSVAETGSTFSGGSIIQIAAGS
jgi:hypothetical protein